MNERSEALIDAMPTPSGMKTGRQCRILILIVLALLVPFLNKAFNVDEPLFLWSADQIRQDPLHPYYLHVNWYGLNQPMATVMQNPPLHSYFLAAVQICLGTSELCVHLAMLLPTVLCVLAVYDLARSIGANPVAAALWMLVTPVFLVSASTAMCDVPMLAWWLWACAFWIRGIDGPRHRWLAAAVVCAGFAGLTKYFGLALVPLLLAHGLVRRRAIGVWVLWLLIPIGMYGLWSWWSQQLYGVSHMSQAGQYSRNMRSLLLGQSSWTQVAIACSFAGGGLLLPLVLPWQTPNHRRATLVAVAATLVILAGTSMMGTVKWSTPPDPWQLGQWYLFVFGGVWMLVAAVQHLGRFRDANAVLLALWIFGTFFFAAFFNWTVSGRTVLPLAPAVALLLAREQGTGSLFARWRLTVSTAVMGAIALLLVRADSQWANSCRTAAHELAQQPQQSGQQVWFVGHWGMQYYLQRIGARPLRLLVREPPGPPGSAVVVGVRPLRVGTPQIGPEDLVLRPINNTNVPDSFSGMTLVDRRHYSTSQLVTLMVETSGAGFYASGWGPLPFSFGSAPPEEYEVFQLKR